MSYHRVISNWRGWYSCLVLSSQWFTSLLAEHIVNGLSAQLWHRRGLLTVQLGQLSIKGYRGVPLYSSGREFVPIPNGSQSKGLPHDGRWRAYGSEFIPMVWSCPCVCFLQPNEVRCYPHMAFNDLEHKGLSQVTSTVFKFIPFKVFHHGRDTGCCVIIALNKATCCFPMDFSRRFISWARWGSHIAAPYSNTDLTRAMQDCSFNLAGHLRILLHMRTIV